MLNFIVYPNRLQDTYSNILSAAYQVGLTLPITSLTCERSFSKLKVIKACLIRSITEQSRLKNL